MPQKLASDALGFVKKAFGLIGKGEQETQLLDGLVYQMLDAGVLARRGRTLADSQGIFTGIIRNVHGAANTIDTAITPYEFGATGLVAPFPSPVPPEFDFWLFGASMLRTAGAGGLTTAALNVEYSAESQGFGITDGGLAVAGRSIVGVALWDALIAETSTYGQNSVSGLLYQPIGLRLPRLSNTTLHFSSTAAAAATFQLLLVCGLFPVSLGQDVVA